MRSVILCILIYLFNIISFAQNINYDFIHKGIQTAKEQKNGLAISYLQFSTKDKSLPDSIKFAGKFYLQYAYYNSNNDKFSINELDSIVPKYSYYNDTTATSFIRHIAYILSQNGYYDKALEYGKQATKRIKYLYGNQSLEYAYSLDNLSIRFRDCELLDSALLCVNEAGIIIKNIKGKNNIDYANNQNILASIYADKKQHKKAIYYGHKAVDIAKTTNATYQLAIFLDKLGHYYWLDTKFQSSIKYSGESLNILRTNNSSKNNYAITLSNLAQKYTYLGEFDTAINAYEESLNIIEQLKGKKNLDYARILYDLSICHWNKGDYKKYCNYSSLSVSIMDNIYNYDDFNYLFYQKDIVDKTFKQEDYIRTKSLIERILDYNVSLSYTDSIFYYSCLSTCYAKISGDYIKAFRLQNKAVGIAEKHYNTKNKEEFIKYLKLKCDEIECLMNSFTLDNDNLTAYNKKLESIEESVYGLVILGERHLVKNDPLLINIYNLLTTYYINIKRIEDAYNLNTNILSETPNIDVHSRISILNKLTQLNFIKEDYYSAIQVCNEIIELLKSDETLKLDTYYNSLALLASCYIGNKQHDMAIKILNLRNTEIQKNTSIADYLNNDNEGIYTSWYMYNYLSAILYYNNNNTYSNLTYDTTLKYKNFQSEIISKIMENSIYNESESIYNKYLELNKLGRKLKILIECGKTNDKDIKSINRTIKKLKNDLLKESVNNINIHHLINLTWQDVQRTLNSNDISIEFVEVEKDKYIALLLKNDWKNVQTFRFTISNNVTQEEQYIRIWKPIEEYIKPGDNIYFSASGILHQIPIESLPIGDGMIMSDVYNMYRLSSTRELVKKKKEMKYTKAVLYGGLNYDMTDDELLSASQTYTKDASTEYFVSRGLLEDSIRGYKWDNLSNTQQEVDYISDLMKKNQITTQIYKGNKGNEESFKALSGHEYNIIHLATHGFFYPDEEAKEKDYFKPMLLNDHYQKFNEVDMSMWRSGLVMSGGNRAWKGDTIPDTVEDGILKAQEIGDLDLRGADLVVLSACNTGQGEVTGEGVFGLQRAFKMAGAQTIVMSLTPVDDQTTMAMMNKFYTNLFSGQSKHDAFYNAQRYIRSIKPDPKYWMGWIMLD